MSQDILSAAEVAEYISNFGPRVDALVASHESLRQSLTPLEDALVEARQQASTALEHWRRETEFLRERLVVADASLSRREKALSAIAGASGVNKANWFQRLSEIMTWAEEALEGDRVVEEPSTVILEFSGAMSAIRAGLNLGPTAPQATSEQMTIMNDAWAATQNVFAMAERAHVAERRYEELASELEEVGRRLQQARTDRQETEERMDDEVIAHGLTEERADAAETKLADMTRWYETVLSEREEARRRLVEEPQEQALITAHAQALARAEGAEAELLATQEKVRIYETALETLGSAPLHQPSSEEATLALIEVEHIAAEALRAAKM